MSMYWGKYYLR